MDYTILGLAVDNNTVVTKWGIDEDNVQPQYMWNISLSHHQVTKVQSIKRYRKYTKNTKDTESYINRNV